MYTGDEKNSHVAVLVVLSLFLAGISYSFLWSQSSSRVFFKFESNKSLSNKTEHVTKDTPKNVTRDLLQIALEGASKGNKKTLVISIVNKAYAEENGLLDLFLQSLRIGKDTKFLINHLLLVAADQISYDRCKHLRLHCYKLVTDGIDFSGEALYATDDFLTMMWRRTLFLCEVLKRGYSFIFTDMDVIWLRNPFPRLGNEGEDMQISSNWSPAGPFDESNPINTGFFFVASNNRTISLFDAWYEAKNTSGRLKEQDVLQNMIKDGILRKLGMKVRFLNDLIIGGFCGRISSFEEIATMHANCCRTVKAKLIDLKEILQDWKDYNNGREPKPELTKDHKACAESWKLLP